MSGRRLFRTMQIRSYAGLQGAYDRLGPGWIFRGHRDATWPLKPSLERAAHDRFAVPWAFIPDLERNLISEFKRHAHRYLEHVPSEQHTIEWCALMQHYGAPTRLLDWTYSFHVAVFFAAAQAAPDTRGAVWALNLPWCWRQAHAALPEELRGRIPRNQRLGKNAEAARLVLELRQPLVVPVNPFLLNERLAVQQGVFVAPLDLSRSFLDNLQALIPHGNAPLPLIKLTLHWTPPFLRRTLTELQLMNVTHVSLFPGLEGLALSLENRIAGRHGQVRLTDRLAE